MIQANRGGQKFCLALSALTAVVATQALAQTPAAPVLGLIGPEALPEYWVLDDRIPPKYPNRAFQSRTGGEVKISYTIGPDGRPADLDIVYSVPGGVFDAAVSTAVSEWHYRPGSGNPNGSPIRTFAVLRFQPDGIRPARTMVGELRHPDDPEAAGKNGWVRLAYDITAGGAVQNARVLEAQPAGLFNAAAKRAVETRRYAPLVIEGSAVPVAGQIDVVRFFGDKVSLMADCILADPATASPFEITDTGNGPCPARHLGRQYFLALDYDSATQVLEPLANAGDPEAALLMGAMRDPRFHQISHRQSYMEAYFDATEAVRWYRTGIDTGDPYCVLQLINMGDGTSSVLPREFRRTERLLADWGYQPRVMERHSRDSLRIRLDSGDSIAAFHYAMIVIHESTGSHWLRIARQMLENRAKKGSGVHQWYAGRALLVGPRFGLRPDLPRAFAWFSTAAANGVEHARGYQYAVGEELRPREVERAEELTREFVELYVSTE